MGGCTRNRHQRPTGRHLARQPLDGVVSSQTRTFHLSNLLLCSYYPTVCYVLRCYSRYSMFSRYSKLFPPTSTFHLNNLLLCCYSATGLLMVPHVACISLLQGPQGATVFYISLLQDATPSHIPLSRGTLLHIGGMLFYIDILLLPSAFAIFYNVRPF